jgi:hypothetical protein
MVESRVDDVRASHCHGWDFLGWSTRFTQIVWLGRECIECPRHSCPRHYPSWLAGCPSSTRGANGTADQAHPEREQLPSALLASDA